jgi:hypothetical protein
MNPQTGEIRRFSRPEVAAIAGFTVALNATPAPPAVFIDPKMAARPNAATVNHGPPRPIFRRGRREMSPDAARKRDAHLVGASRPMTAAQITEHNATTAARG